MLTVNVTCVACDGTRPCAECRAAGRALTAAGHHVQHSSRTAALRAALAGTYGFEACIVPLAAGERAVADAAVALFDGQSVALAVDDPAVLPHDLPARFRVIERSAFRAGHLPPDWPPQTLAESKTKAAPARLGAGQDHATRRLRDVGLRQGGRRTKGRAREKPPEAKAIVEDEIAWCKASGSVFSIVLVRAPEADEALMVRLLAGVLRAGDGVGRHDGGYVAVLAGAGARVTGAIMRRLNGALGASKSRFRAFFGAASYPADAADAAALFARASGRLGKE
jgi:hypothetical protein